MTDETDDKSDVEKGRDLISQLKEMQHYSEANIEKLTEIWLMLDGELKQKEMAARVEKLIAEENVFHDDLAAVVSDYEIECNRIENEAS